MLIALDKLRYGTSEDDIVVVDTNYLGNNFYFFPLLSGKKIFLTGIGILADHRVSYEERYKSIRDMPSTSTEALFRQFNTKYVVTKHDSLLKLYTVNELWFSNDEVDIYKLK